MNRSPLAGNFQGTRDMQAPAASTLTWEQTGNRTGMFHHTPPTQDGDGLELTDLGKGEVLVINPITESRFNELLALGDWAACASEPGAVLYATEGNMTIGVTVDQEFQIAAPGRGCALFHTVLDTETVSTPTPT